MTRATIRLAKAASAALLALCLNAANAAAVEDTPVRGGTLTMIVTPEPTAMTGAFNTAGPMTVVSSKIFDGLVSYDFDFNLKPQLATSWEVAPDGKTITFHLRQGVKWHDGKDFTSADVAFSLMNAWKVHHARGKSTFGTVTNVETPDPYTAVLKLSAPAPSIMNALVGYESQIIPKHIYEGTDLLNNPANNAPIGTGPFKFVEWKRGSAIVVERNPDYWDKGKPYLDRIVFRIIPDGAGRATALETGEVQLAGNNPVPLADVERLSKLPSLATTKKGYEYTNNIHLIEFNTRRGPFQDVRVRQAVAHAINLDFIAKNIWFGNATASTGPVPVQMARYYTKDVPRYEFSVAKANKILDDAGYKRGAGGIRFKIFHDWAPYGESFQRTAEYIKQSLRAVGIDVEIRSADVPSYMRRVYTDYDFDMINYFVSAMPDPTIGVQRFYWSKTIQKGSAFSNASGYANPEMDKVLEAAAQEIDPAKRRDLYVQFQKIAMTDLPLLPVVDINYVTFANKRVHNHTISPDGIRANFAEVWLSPQ